MVIPADPEETCSPCDTCPDSGFPQACADCDFVDGSEDELEELGED